MGRHFHWVKDDLEFIADALQRSLKDEEPLTQMRAARCLDVIANAINLFLLSQNSNRDVDFDDVVKKCLRFWTKMLPCIVEEFQREDQTPAIKTILCDACANIGVHMFERLEVGWRMWRTRRGQFQYIFSLLFSEENTDKSDRFVIEPINQRRGGSDREFFGCKSTCHFCSISVAERR